jgi:ribokinase
MPAFPVLAVDTTAAGDTFIGYFIAEIISGSSIKRSVEIATKAASICVTRKGAADSIPKKNELSF